MIRLSVLILILFCSSYTSFAQEYKITGKVLNDNNKPVDYATVCLIRENQLIAGTISTDNGDYSLSIKAGEYILSVSCIGLEPYQKVILIEKDINLGNIQLHSSTISLKEVTVQGKRPLVTREIDRIVFDAQQLSSVAFNALELLRNTPGILVNEEDNIQIVGKGNIIVLINNREVKMDGKELSSYLKSYTSNDISKIEVMTTPPAKYSAEGNAGVINILLKKNINDYLGGYLSDEQVISKYTVNDYAANLQYKQNNISSFLNISGGTGTRKNVGKSSKYFTDETWNNKYSQKTSNEFMNARTGVDITLPKQYIAGIHLSYMHFTPDEKKNEETQIYNSINNPIYLIEGHDFSDRGMDRFNASLHLDKMFGNTEKSMSIDVDYMGYWVKDNKDYLSTGNHNFFYDNNLDRSINIYSSKLDFDLPYEKYKITTGGYFSHSTTKNEITYLRQSINQNLDDNFSYKETIAALYADCFFKLGKYWTSKIGVRGEYYYTKSNSIVTEETIDRSKINIFPTFYLRYAPTKVNTFNLSFTSRIRRPSYSTVNPFIQYLDEYNIVTGNPYLNPEISYITELGYTFKGNLTFGFSHRYTNDIVGKVTEIDNTNKTTYYLWDNYMKNQIILFNVSYRLRKLKWMESYLTNNIYNLRSKSDAYSKPLDENKWAYLVFLNNTIFFNQKKNFTGQLSGQFQTAERTADKYVKNRYRINVGIKYITFNKQLTLGAMIQNLISSDTKRITYSNGLQLDQTDEVYRIFRISATYTFGAKLSPKKRIYSNQEMDSRL